MTSAVLQVPQQGVMTSMLPLRQHGGDGASRSSSTAPAQCPPATASAAPAAVPREPRSVPWWKAWLTISIFRFASGELEGLYEHYIASTVNLWTLAHSGHVIMGWIVFTQKLMTAPRKLRAYVPAAWPIAFLHPLQAGILILIILFKPAFYNQHRQALHAGVICVFMTTFRMARAVVLWMRLANAKGVQSWMQQLQSFTVENFYFTIMWVLQVAYPVAQVPAIVLATVYMLSEMASNTHLCSLPQWRDNISVIATVSPRVLAWTRTASSWISGLGHPDLAAKAMSMELSCPAALGFWQVVGWWLACHAAFAAEVFRRRAFLRTHAALAHLGPAHLEAAMKWPFGRSSMLLRMIITSLALSCYASVFWSIILHVIQ
eukprot:jgi/Botrbrau1/21964/Bobra.0249s0087.1